MGINNRRGITLLAAYLVIAVLAILGTAFVVRSISEGLTIKKHADSSNAFWIAETGIQKALWEKNYNNCANCTSCGSSLCLNGNLASGSYSVTISGTVITSVGTSSLGAIRRIRVDTIGGSPFTYAMFGASSIYMTNNAHTDSYDSSLGPYGGDNAYHNGDVGTNGTATGAITILNNGVIEGDANTGPGGTIEKSQNAEITGDITHDNNISLPLVYAPQGFTTEPGGDLNVSGDETPTLNSGDYRYNSISISNNAILTISGTVRIYVTSTAQALEILNNAHLNIASGANLVLYSDGKCDLGNNGLVNNTAKPENFVLWSAYSGSNGVQINNNGNMYGVIYAPNANISVTNNGSIFGSIIGNELSVSNNAHVHYDEHLPQVLSYPEGNSKISVKNWQEL